MNTLLTYHHRDIRDKTLSEFFKKNQFHFQNYFLYSIEILIPLNTIEISEKNLLILKRLLRSLINGKKTIDGLNNRDWFSKYFSGGLYTINIYQPSPGDYPVIEYHMICFSKSNNLEHAITNDLDNRIKNILNKAELKSFYHEPFSVAGISNLEENFAEINSTSGFHFFSKPVRMLTKSYLSWLFSVMHQPVETFGTLYQNRKKKE